jgi:hypothetical protein
MAINFSQKQLNIAQKKFYGRFYVIKNELNLFDKIINKLLIYFYFTRFTLINFKRKIFSLKNLIIFNKVEEKQFNFEINAKGINLKKISQDLRVNNYSFIKNFLTLESYKYLIYNWPDINYFNHNKQIIKHYNSRKEWSINKKFKDFRKSPYLKNFIKYLLSTEFKKFCNELTNFENKDYEICAISSSMATNGSFLIPHIDGVYKNKEEQEHYNFIYFLDGYDEIPKVGGGTGFYKDNEFKLPIFIPDTIKNSLIIYNQSEKFYHGFDFINCPKYISRKTINFQIKPTRS